MATKVPKQIVHAEISIAPGEVPRLLALTWPGFATPDVMVPLTITAVTEGGVALCMDMKALSRKWGEYADNFNTLSMAAGLTAILAHSPAAAALSIDSAAAIAPNALPTTVQEFCNGLDEGVTAVWITAMVYTDPPA